MLIDEHNLQTMTYQQSYIFIKIQNLSWELFDMMYPSITLADETEITHSHINEENDVKKVQKLLLIMTRQITSNI